MNILKNRRNKDKISQELEEDISIHIFSTSAFMVGACLTVIGIFQVGELRQIASVSDNILAIDAIAFLISCVLSYVALRTRTSKRRHKIEQFADAIFIIALCLMALVCVLIAYTLI